MTKKAPNREAEGLSFRRGSYARTEWVINHSAIPPLLGVEWGLVNERGYAKNFSKSQ